MSPTRRLFAYVWRYRGAFLFGFFCIVATSAISLAGPWVLKYAIDDLTRTGVTAAKLRLYGGAILGLAAAGGVFRFFFSAGSSSAHPATSSSTSATTFFARLQLFEPAYFHRNRTGDLMSRATNDLNAVRMMIGPAVMYLSNTVLTFVAVIVVMLSLNRRLTLLSLIPLPILSVAVYFFGAAIHRRFDKIQEQLSTISAVTQEALAGVRVVRAYRQERFEIERFREANNEYVRRNRKLIRVQGAFFPIMGLLMGVGALLVLWLGSRDVIEGRMTVGELVAFNSYLWMLAWPMIAFGLGDEPPPARHRVLEAHAGGADDRARHHGRRSRFTRRLARPDSRRYRVSQPDLRVRRPLDSARGRRGRAAEHLRKVARRDDHRHRWRDRLRQVDDPQPAAAAQDPAPGTVFVDEVDVRELPLAVLRGAIGFVPQEPFLFARRLRTTSRSASRTPIAPRLSRLRTCHASTRTSTISRRATTP